jgi:nicotinate-nucleotide adenylyltransferase
VANRPWQKEGGRDIAPPEDRLAMVRAAAEGLERIEVSRLEIDRGGPSYTVDTVEALRRSSDSPPEIAVVVGADLVSSLPTWERVDDLRALVTLAIVTRRGSRAPAPPSGWRSVVIGGVDVAVSSSEVRARLADGLGVDDLLPAPVVRYIARHGLYAVHR